MAVIPVTSTQLNFNFGGTGWPNGGQVVLACQNSSSHAPDVVGDAVAGLLVDNLGARIPEDVTLLSVLAKNGPNETGPFAVVSIGVTGSGSGGDVNPNQAILLRKNTALGGRRGRGRIYWPVAEDQVGTGGALHTSPDEVAAANTAWAALLSDMTAAGYPMQLLHNVSSESPNAVVSISCQPVTATQRRRLRR